MAEEKQNQREEEKQKQREEEEKKQREEEQKGKRKEEEEAEAGLTADPEVLQASMMAIAKKASATRDGWGAAFRELLPQSLPAEVLLPREAKRSAGVALCVTTMDWAATTCKFFLVRRIP